MIHSTAVIDPKAHISEGVTVGPYVVIGAGVRVGAGTHIKAHSVIEGPQVIIGKNNVIGPQSTIERFVTIGDHNQVFPSACIGAAPQDLKFKGEDSWVKIGDHNQIREYVTINRGTAVGGGVTRVGDHNFIMAYVHIAHDCLIGNHVIMANSVGLAGHVEIRDHAIIGGMVGIGQYCRIGTFAYLGGFSKVRRDILPFMITAGSGVEVYVKGVNSIGLSRKGVSKETIRALKEAYKQIFIGSLTVQEGITIVKSKKSQVPEVVALIKFIENTKQGISGNRKEQNVQEDQSSSHRGGVPRELSH